MTTTLLPDTTGIFQIGGHGAEIEPQVPFTTAQALFAIDFLDSKVSCSIEDLIPTRVIHMVMRLGLHLMILSAALTQNVDHVMDSDTMREYWMKIDEDQ